MSLFQKGGFFIEAGALDGERSSNTYYLEAIYGWTGLLVEMDPYYFIQILGKSRHAYSINSCISPDIYPAIVSTCIETCMMWTMCRILK